METINEIGFLSEEIIGYIKKHRKDYAEYFSLCEDIGRLSHKIMFSIEIHNEYLPEILGASLLARAVSNFQGSVLLAERGMINESKALLRCMLEVMFAVVAIAKDKSFAYDLVKVDVFKRKRALKACERSANAGVKFFSQEDVKKVLEQLGKEIEQEVKRTDIKNISTRCIAKKAGLETIYDSEYSILSSTIHADLRDLEQYLDMKNGGKLGSMLWGPNDKDIDIVLLGAADAMFRILDGVFQVFSIDGKKKKLLLKKYNELAKSFTILNEEFKDEPL